MAMNNYISIGIPFFNADSFLEYAIKSVIAQNYPYWELILIDDGSTDNSLEIAEKYAKLDKRIRVINDGYNKKLPYRLNQIIHEANYDYIARMDADDLMAVDRLEKQIEFLVSNPDFDLVTTGMFSINNNNQITGRRILKNYQMTPQEMLGGLTNLLHASLLAKKDWCLRNLYIESNALAEDYELWISSNLKNDLKYYVLEEPLYYYREGENVKKEKMIRGYNTQIQVINRYYKGTISKSSKDKIVFKFFLKKIIVKFLDFLNLMFILEKKRVEKITSKDKELFRFNLEKMKCL